MDLQFENEHVCVWKTVISQGQPLDKFSQDRILIGLNGGNLQQIEENDLGKDPVEIMVVEMKRPKDRPFPSQPID